MAHSLSGAKVLLTGAGGFLGSYVRHMLADAGAEIIPLTKTNGFDLRNESEALTAVFLSRPDVVVHLAAPPREKDRPAAFFRDYVTMGLNVINASSMVGAKVVMLFPLAIYPDDAPSPLKEEFLGWGETAEGGGYRTLLNALRAYHRQHKLAFSALLASEIYGAGIRTDFDRRPVNRMLMSMAYASSVKPAPVVLHNPKHTISPIHASDAARAVVAACATPDLTGPINLQGPVLTWETAATTAAAFLKFKGEVKWIENDEPNRWLEKGAMVDSLKWEPEVTFAAGMAESLPQMVSIMKGKT